MISVTAGRPQVLKTTIIGLKNGIKRLTKSLCERRVCLYAFTFKRYKLKLVEVKLRFKIVEG